MVLRVVPRYLAFGLGVEQIAEELELNVEDVRLVAFDNSIIQKE